MDSNSSNEIPNQGGQPPGDPKSGDTGAFSQQFSHSPVAARVPDKVGAGVISTGIVVLDSPNEFIVDFLQGLSRPYKIAQRVVLTPAVMQQFIQASQDNLNRFTQAFGPPPPLPKPPPHRPTIAEIYENFKIDDNMLSGAYANSVMIGHSPAEFFFDFITGFYPTAAVSARVYLSAPRMPSLVDTLTLAMKAYHQRYHGKQPPQGPQGPTGMLG
jgi:hypothetical protein